MSSSKTAGGENGVFLPRINREKVKFYADTDTIFFEVAVLRIHRGYLLFGGEYQIYFIECGENISKLTSA